MFIRKNAPNSDDMRNLAIDRPRSMSIYRPIWTCARRLFRGTRAMLQFKVNFKIFKKLN